MKKVNDLYNLEKFWTVYTRQERAISKWDNERTDKEVFINRTIAKWFVGKFYQVEIERHKHFDPFPFAERPKNFKVFTKYVYITNIRFAFAPYHDLININFIEPHSEKIEQVSYGINDFINLKLCENEGDFRILKKFYPIRVEQYPMMNILNINNERKPRKNNSAPR